MLKLTVSLVLAAIIGTTVLVVEASAEPRPDQCHDIFELHAGRAEPTRQAWFNHLDARGYARYWIACTEGWGTDQWYCLHDLWDHESSWYHLANNPRSTAFGIWQGLASTRKAYLGADWQTTNPRRQVQGGVDYIDDRYGVPTATGCRGPY